jgi:hypothetical protein
MRVFTQYLPLGPGWGIIQFVGYAPAEGDGTYCDLLANQFYLPPFSTTTGCSSMSWSTPYDFAVGTGSIGYYYEASSITPATWDSIKDFSYTDVKFQWNCPVPPCQSDAGGAMSETGTCISCNCQRAFGTWSGTSCTSAMSTWSSPGGAMANVVIDFN